MAEELPLKGVVTLEVSEEEINRLSRAIGGAGAEATASLVPARGAPAGGGAGESPEVVAGLQADLQALAGAVNRLIAVLPVAARVFVPGSGAGGARPGGAPLSPFVPQRGERPGETRGLFASIGADIRRAVAGIGRSVAPGTSQYLTSRAGAVGSAFAAAPLPVKAIAAAAVAVGATPLLAGLLGGIAQRRLNRLVGEGSEFSPQLTAINLLREQGQIRRAQIRGEIAGPSGIALQRETNRLLEIVTTIMAPINAGVNSVLAVLTRVLNFLLGPLERLIKLLTGANANATTQGLFNRMVAELGGTLAV